MRPTTTFLAMILIGSNAVAAEQPLRFPLRDVTVLTVMEVGGGYRQAQRYYYLASAQKSRVETADFELYVLMDYQAGTSVTVVPGAPPTYTVMPIPDDRAVEYSQTGGREHIAGHECIVWQSPAVVKKNPTAGFPGQPATYTESTSMCLTPDGVPLRTIIEQDLVQKTRVVVEATDIKYGPVDPALFFVPAGAVRR
jgi:hypothetical protein